MFYTATNRLTGITRSRWIQGLTQEAIDSWRAGALIQDAMPNVRLEDREFIMSGIVPEDSIFEEPTDSVPEYVTVPWPESQKYMDTEGAFLIIDPYVAGPSAYMVPKSKYQE